MIENLPLLRCILEPQPLIPILGAHLMRRPPLRNIILLHHRPVPIRKAARHHPQPPVAHPLRLLRIPIPPQPIPRQHLVRRPPIREIPLLLRTERRDGPTASFAACAQSAELFEFRERGGHEEGGLVRGGEAGPERPEGGDGLVALLLLGDGVVVEVEAFRFVPAVPVDAGFAGAGAPVPEGG